MMLIMLMNMKWSMLLYFIMTTYDVRYMKRIFIYGLLSFLFDYWGYEASEDHCTCRFGITLLVSIFYVKFICTIEHEI